MTATKTINITYSNGETAAMPTDTPIYVESWARANSARDDDGSMASIEDLVPAGTLASPDFYVGGVDVAEATWYVEDLGTGDERICVAIAAIEDTTDTTHPDTTEDDPADPATPTDVAHHMTAAETARHLLLAIDAAAPDNVEHYYTQGVDECIAQGLLVLVDHQYFLTPLGEEHLATEAVESALEAYIDLCTGTREEIEAAIAAQGFRPGCPEIEALSAEDRAEAIRRVEESC